MKILNSLVEDFGGFVLDANAIDLRSASKQDIMLPYHGSLPAQMSEVSGAQIYLNIQVSQPIKVALVVSSSKGKKHRFPMDATAEEVKSLLDRFFDQKQNSGLSSYWLGIWQANYITWRQLTVCPSRLTDFLDGISDKDRAYLLEYLSIKCKQNPSRKIF